MIEKNFTRNLMNNTFFSHQNIYLIDSNKIQDQCFKTSNFVDNYVNIQLKLFIQLHLKHFARCYHVFHIHTWFVLSINHSTSTIIISKFFTVIIKPRFLRTYTFWLSVRFFCWIKLHFSAALTIIFETDSVKSFTMLSR